VLAAIGFVVAYVLHADTQVLGLAAGIALLALAVAAGVAALRLVPQEAAEGSYPDHADTEARAHVEDLVAGTDDGISRRRLLLGAAGAAGASVAAAAAVPIASLGPDVGHRLDESPWKAGKRLLTTDGKVLRADDVREGQLYLALPEGTDARHEFTASVNVLRLGEDIVAYSRICTHAGCAVSMYRSPKFDATEPGPALVCPCHYSTFDPARDGAVTFGPAGRPLPKLPLRTNAAGELEAAGDFVHRAGPTWDGARER
jgi:ubiquinol-cytochrome c reductase iron-sulfur subunit